MLGMCELACDRYAEAEEALREALARCQAIKGHWVRFVIESTLGGVFLETGRLDQAEPLLLEAYQGLKPLNDLLPDRWRRLGLEETTRRLVKLHRLKGASDLLMDGEHVREEAAAH